jgi:hypothetical protein
MNFGVNGCASTRDVHAPGNTRISQPEYRAAHILSLARQRSNLYSFSELGASLVPLLCTWSRVDELYPLFRGHFELQRCLYLTRSLPR